MSQQLQSVIDTAWENRANISIASATAEVRDAVKVARPGEAPYPAGVRSANNNEAAPAEAPAETPAAETVETATDGQEG